jgi:hypothetical protein
MPLELMTSLELAPTAPFAFDPTFHKPDHFSSGDNDWEPGVRWQTWNWRGRRLGLKFSQRGTVEQPGLRVDVYDTQPVDQVCLSSSISTWI